MRSSSAAFVVALPLLLSSAPAWAETVNASHYGIVRPDGGRVTVLSVCTGEADRTTATVSVTCSIDDASPGPGVSETCDSPTSKGVCSAQLLDGPMPVTICASATATFTDSSTVTDVSCRTYGA